MRLKRYEEAKIIFEEAILTFPENQHLYQLMITCLVNKQEPAENLVPYIRAYFKHKSPAEKKIPNSVKLILKLVKPGFDFTSYYRKMKVDQAEWEKWAVNFLHRFDKKPVIDHEFKSEVLH